jgi:hypothetical protein
LDSGFTGAPGLGRVSVTAVVIPAKSASRLVTSIDVE